MTGRNQHSSHRPHWRTAILGGLAALVATVSPATAAGPEIVTHRDQFKIPFDFDAARLAAVGAETVELYVRIDGNRWELAKTTQPSERAFLYQATQEASYDFCVRARNTDGSRIPDGPLAPSLTVVVDKTDPLLSLSVQRTADGSNSVSWSVQDANVDLNSLSLETRDENGEWSPASIRVAAQGATVLPPDAGDELRFVIKDKAGHTAEETRRLTAPTTQLASANAPASLAAPVIAAGAQANAPAEIPAATVSAAATPEPAIVAPKTPAPTFTEPIIEPKVPEASLESIMGINPANIPAPLPQQTASVPTPGHSTGDAAFPEDTAWSMSITKRVKTHTFRMGYELDDVGPSGLASVALYITEDYGRSWFHYGNDIDNKSPMDVTVPKDGVYGFSFRVTSGTGFGDLPPQPGERPDIAIAVDQTLPVIQMQPLGHSRGANAHQIAIRWSAFDASLPPRPIKIEYGSSPSGPWTPVAPALPNIGEYVWDVTQPMPGAVYLRVSVTDAAGNVASDFTREPLMLDFSRPAARITGVESIIQ